MMESRPKHVACFTFMLPCIVKKKIIYIETNGRTNFQIYSGR